MNKVPYPSGPGGGMVCEFNAEFLFWFASLPLPASLFMEGQKG